MFVAKKVQDIRIFVHRLGSDAPSARPGEFVDMYVDDDSEFVRVDFTNTFKRTKHIFAHISKFCRIEIQNKSYLHFPF